MLIAYLGKRAQATTTVFQSCDSVCLSLHVAYATASHPFFLNNDGSFAEYLLVTR